MSESDRARRRRLRLVASDRPPEADDPPELHPPEGSGRAPDPAELHPERILRFQVPGEEALERLTSGPLPLEMEGGAARLDFFRDLYFDTSARDLERKGAAVRLRIRQDGRRSLLVDIRERVPGSRALLRRRSEADVLDVPAADVFSGATEPARLLRALIDPARLDPAFELETMRHYRAAGSDGPSGASPDIELTCDVVTVRQGELAGEFRELEIRIPEDSPVDLDPLIAAFHERYGLRVTLADTGVRARELLENLEARLLADEVRGAREVVVIPYRNGRIALRRTKAGLELPGGTGMGQEACRRMLRAFFGRTRGRLRILGTAPATTNRPAMEVWLAENVRDDSKDEEEGQSRVWLPLEDALAKAGTAGLRDSRTLGALHVLARTDLPGRLAWAWKERSRRMQPDDSLAPEVLLEQAMPTDPTLPAGSSPSEMPPSHLLNQELSRLAFDERVLLIAEDPQTPLLERVRFLGMFGARQDDFFMSRVAKFKEQIAAGVEELTNDGLTPGEQIDLIAIRAREMSHRAYELLLGDLLPGLEGRGIDIVPWKALREEEKEYLEENYYTHVEGVLTPLARDATHPFPNLEPLRPYVGAIVRPPGSAADHFVAIEMPEELPRFVPLPEGYRFIPLEEVVLASLPELYPGLEVVRGHTFRVTRSINLNLDDEEDVDDVLQAVEEEVELRPYRPVVRLEVDEEMPGEMVDLLLRELQHEEEGRVTPLGEQDVYRVRWMVGFRDLGEVASLDIGGLRFKDFERSQPLDPDRPVVDQVAERDVLLHFPYDAFEGSVERFIREAAEDPAVLAIKLTVYRTNPTSRVVDALRKARSAGKDAVAMVELKASLDEEANIEWARHLEDAGIHVVFSPPKYKVHAKIALVVRREGDGVRRYVYIGTGNLNTDTASSYVDIGILTADQELADEVSAVFNILTGYSAGVRCRNLLISPFNMRGRFLQLIEREIEHARAGKSAGIRLQINGLADRRLIDALYRASGAGVRVEAIVREICCLRPGVEGLSENIRVVSLLGRFLQHTRMFRFENAGSPEYFIGSADWRPRNLDRRIEIVAPVRDPEHKERLGRILEETLAHPDAWLLTSDGTYVRDGEVVGRTTTR